MSLAQSSTSLYFFRVLHIFGVKLVLLPVTESAAKVNKRVNFVDCAVIVLLIQGGLTTNINFYCVSYFIYY